MTRGPLVARLQPAFGVTEERDHLVAHDLDDLLRRRKAPKDVLPERPIPYAVDERLDDLELTSASSKARRISRSAASTFSGVSRVSPRRDLNTS
jgi:hypothetical protein